MNKNTELNYSQFKELGNNNFHCHFVSGDCNTHRKMSHFLKFQQKHPQLESKLTSDFTSAWHQHVRIPFGFERLMDQFRPRMYDAYSLMRIFAESDREIFS